MSSSDDREQVLASYRAIHRWMVAADTDQLDTLLDSDYALTHMTGYRQSKREWLEQIDSGQMQYHSSRERDVTVDITGVTAVMVGRNVVDATIWGSRGTWNLQLTTSYQRRDGDWIATTTIASTF
jgi:hypothetical protein